MYWHCAFFFRCKFEPWNKYSSKMNKYQNPARTETDMSFD